MTLISHRPLEEGFGTVVFNDHVADRFRENRGVVFLRIIGAETGACSIANDIRHRRNAIVAEDLEEFERHRNAGANQDNCRDRPEGGSVLIPPVMQKVCEDHEPADIADDVHEIIRGEREVLKGNPTNRFPVCVSDEISQRKKWYEKEHYEPKPK